MTKERPGPLRRRVTRLFYFLRGEARLLKRHMYERGIETEKPYNGDYGDPRQSPRKS